MSEYKEALEIIKHYQKWRRGDEELEQPDPQELGVALDRLIALADKVMGEPSDGMLSMAHQYINQEDENGRVAESADVFKVMRDQLIAEIGDV